MVLQAIAAYARCSVQLRYGPFIYHSLTDVRNRLLNGGTLVHARFDSLVVSHR